MAVTKSKRTIEFVLTAKNRTAQAFRKVGTVLDKVKTSVNNLVFSFKGLLTGVAAGAVGKYFVDLAVSSDKLEASLRTVTGSVDDAADALETIRDFAKETPISVNEVADAFIKLKSRGLDPSMETIRAYGSVALGLGKSLDQFIEAVADAAVGEFERLKEFGIKARKEGEEVTFTFNGLSTTVKNTAADIEGYLSDIGKNEFGQALENQANTLGGAFDKLGGAINEAAKKIWDSSGLGTGLTYAVKGMTTLITAATGATTSVGKLESKIADVKRQLEELGRFDIKSPFLSIIEKAFDIGSGTLRENQLTAKLQRLEKELAEVKEGKEIRAAERKREADEKEHQENLDGIQKEGVDKLKNSLKAREAEFKRHEAALAASRDKQKELLQSIADAGKEFEDFGKETPTPDRFDIVEATGAAWDNINAGDTAGARAAIQTLIDMFRAYQEAGKASAGDVVLMTSQLEALGRVTNDLSGEGLEERAARAKAAAQAIKEEIENEKIGATVGAAEGSGKAVRDQTQEQILREQPVTVQVGIELANQTWDLGASSPSPGGGPGADVRTESDKRGFRI